MKRNEIFSLFFSPARYFQIDFRDFSIIRAAQFQPKMPSTIAWPDAAISQVNSPHNTVQSTAFHKLPTENSQNQCDAIEKCHIVGEVANLSGGVSQFSYRAPPSDLLLATFKSLPINANDSNSSRNHHLFFGTFSMQSQFGIFGIGWRSHRNAFKVMRWGNRKRLLLE